MALIVHSGELTLTDFQSRRKEERLWLYNALDATVMHEIHGKLEAQLSPQTRLTYEFDKAQQGPAMTMTLRGMRVDLDEMGAQIWQLGQTEVRVQKFLDRITMEIWGKGLNPRSPAQVKDLLYERMNLPVQFKKDKGEKKVSTDRNALEKLRLYYWATPIVNSILKLRDLRKQIQVLKTGVDPDGRIRFGFSPSAAETGRWTSSKNPRGGGTNGQNINDKMRRIFIADPGMKIGYSDLEQAESRGVAYLSGDPNYIEACESGDLHTAVARMVWPDLEWTGNMALDREIAERPFYRHFSYRDMSKRGGHASNYYGSAWSLSVNLKIAIKAAEEFQDLYFGRFPGIRHWHAYIQEQLQHYGFLVTPLGRKRAFFGRLRDDSTLREAIAYLPQSLIVDIVNIGLLRIWRKFEIDGRGKRLHLYSHQHDGIVFGFREDDDQVCHEVEELMRVPVEVNDRILVIPVETKVGYCWNSDFLDKLGSSVAAKQVRPQKTDLLDLRVS